MFLARRKINEQWPGDSVNDYTTRLINHLLWFMMCELLFGIFLPIFVVFLIVYLATAKMLMPIDWLVEPRDVFFLFAALLCGHIAEIIEKRRPLRVSVAVLLVFIGVMFGAFIRGSELITSINTKGFVDTWPVATTYALVVVALIVSTIALLEKKQEESTASEQAPALEQPPQREQGPQQEI